MGSSNCNCAPLSRPFMDQTKTNRKNKDSRTARMTVCVGPYPICNCCQIFQVFSFFHCTDFLCDIYSVSLTIQNTLQPEELAGGEEVKHSG